MINPVRWQRKVGQALGGGPLALQGAEQPAWVRQGADRFQRPDVVRDPRRHRRGGQLFDAHRAPTIDSRRR